ncbi:MAG: RnfABCDGE type electron transport complex subunit G [Candidatus Omnitrophica bacterium]|nr:RnfABCDGE type electron transport complex subunit G [Candidatus Omnitrophota bacterium]
MNNAVRMILVLIIVGIFSGGVLVSVHNYANPLIADNEDKALKDAVYKVLPDAKNFRKITKNGITLYEGLNKRGEVVGYAFKAGGFGYQGEIEMIAAIDPDLKELKGMEVLGSSETPGLGAEITNEPFKKQFRGLSVLPEITFTKEKATGRNEIQAITGATISTRAVVRILNKEIGRIREAL